MPHAEEMSSTQTITNGDTQQSKVVEHLKGYPVVHDGIETFKSNPYGAKSIEVADAAYNKFGKPFEPYLRTPYSYAKPYVEKADDLADKSLRTVDAHFPIVKEETNTIVDTVLHYTFLPLHLGQSTLHYFLDTWNDEYQKTVRRNDRGPGLTSSVMAIISTELKIASDVLQTAADYLGGKKEQAKQKGQDYNKLGGEYLDQAHNQKDAYVNQFNQTANSYASKAKKAQDDAAKKANESTKSN